MLTYSIEVVWPGNLSWQASLMVVTVHVLYEANNVQVIASLDTLFCLSRILSTGLIYYNYYTCTTLISNSTHSHLPLLCGILGVKVVIFA